MKKEDIIKWLLIAGAAYMVYRYLAQSGIFNQLLPGATPQPVAAKVPQTAPLSAAAIEAALRTAILAQGGNPLTPLNGWEAYWYWSKTPLFDGVEFGPGQLGIVPMDAPAATAEAARLGLTAMANKIATYLSTKASGVAGLIASGPIVMSPTGPVIDMQAGFGGFSMPSAWKN